MSRRLHRLISGLLCAALIFTVFPAALAAEGEEALAGEIPQTEEVLSAPAPAAEPEALVPAAERFTLDPVVQVNPLYRDVVTEEELYALTAESAAAMAQADPMDVPASDYVHTIEDVVAQLREQMKQHKSSAVIYYCTTEPLAQEDLQSIFDAALEHTGEPTEGDYLRWQYFGCGPGAEGYSSGGLWYYTLTYAISYYTTEAQEQTVDAELPAVLDSLDLPGRDDYGKIRAIYDWLCQNVVYDDEHLNITSYKLKYTAYAALHDRTAVCQGYAVLFYRMLLTAGVDARLIAGQGGKAGNTGNHAWNISTPDGQTYYNLDATWGATWWSAQPGLEDAWFLRGETDFTDQGNIHVRDEKYDTPEFHARYPMGQTAYVYPGPAIVITQQPQSVVVAKAGDIASATVAAQGEGLTYQWYIKNTTDAAFRKSSIRKATYSTTVTEACNGRQLYCVITDRDGNHIQTDTITFTIRPGVRITQQPRSVAVAKAGDTASTTVAAVGEGITYQWYLKNPDASGFTKSSIQSATYTAKVTEAVSGRQLYCVVKDKYGDTAQTDTVTFSIAVPVTIITQPTSVVVAKAGDTAAATVVAQGEGLTYQWYIKNTTDASFKASAIRKATYSTKVTEACNGRQLYCVVKDKYGNEVQSDTITFTIAASGPKITTQPANQAVAEGATATFKVVASGTGLKYQWQYKTSSTASWKNSSSATTGYNTATLKVVGTTERNGFQYRCKVTDSNGNTVISNAVTLTVSTGPKITRQPVNAYVKAIGDTAKITVKAQGEGLTYQWYIRNPDANVFTRSSIKKATYSTPVSDASNGRELYCVITDKYGNEVTTDTVTMSVATGLCVITQPEDVSVAAGQRASVTIEAFGEGLKYQWYLKNPGDTAFSKSSFKTATYYTTMQADRSGRQIYCVVTDAGGNTVQTITVTLSMK